MLPNHKILNESKSLVVSTNRGLEFPSPIGLSDGVSLDGRGIDGLLDSFGTSNSGEKGSV